MNSTGLQKSKGGVDLNGKIEFRQIFGGNSPGVTYERRQNPVLSTDGFLAMDYHHPNHRSPRWRPLRQIYDMRRSIPRDGFSQLTYRESLRDIEVCLSAQAAKLYHMGFRHEIKR